MKRRGTSLAVQRLKLLIPNAGSLGLIPGWGTRSHMLQLKILPATTKTWCSHVWCQNVNKYFLKKKQWYEEQCWQRKQHRQRPRAENPNIFEGLRKSPRSSSTATKGQLRIKGIFRFNRGQPLKAASWIYLSFNTRAKSYNNCAISLRSGNWCSERPGDPFRVSQLFKEDPESWFRP